MPNTSDKFTNLLSQYYRRHIIGVTGFDKFTNLREPVSRCKNTNQFPWNQDNSDRRQLRYGSIRSSNYSSCKNYIFIYVYLLMIKYFLLKYGKNINIWGTRNSFRYVLLPFLGGSKSRKMEKYILFLSYLLNAYR